MLGDRAEGPRHPGIFSGGPLPVALTHEQIAALVGISRETATKALGEFAEQDLVIGCRGVDRSSALPTSRRVQVSVEPGFQPRRP